MKSRTILVMLMLGALGCLTSTAALAVEGQASAFTFVSGNDRWIYAFIKGDNGNLKLNRFNGSSWTWIDHGRPEGATSIHSPTAVTYVDAAGIRRIYVFAFTNQWRLVLRYWNGSVWQWANQGIAPVGTPGGYAAGLSAATIVDAQGNRRIYAFFTQGVPLDEGGHRLVTNYWDGFSWQWKDLTNWQPDGSSGNDTSSDCYDSDTTAVSYVSKTGERKVDMFCAHVGNAFKHSWINSAWVSGWTSVALGGNVSSSGPMSSLAFVDASGDPQVHAFYRSTNDQLLDNHNGSWVSLGSPTQLRGGDLNGISAIAYVESDGNRRTQVFTQFNNRLFARTANESAWGPWTDQGLPAGPSIGVSKPSAITWFDSVSGTQRKQVFTTGTNGELYLNYWNGSSWQWLGHGNPP